PLLAPAPCTRSLHDALPIFLDTARPELPGTTIAAAAESVPGVKAISRRNGIVLVSMETVGMWQQVGFLADVFERFRRHGLSVDLDRKSTRLNSSHVKISYAV